MEEVVLFTRQRGETSTGSEQEALEAQIRVIEAFARREQLRIVDRVTRVGVGAGELFQELAAYLLEHTTVRAIITYSTDRLCRSMHNFLELQGMIKDGRLKVYLAREQEVAASSPLTMHFEKALSGYFSDCLSEKIKLQMRDALRRGRWIGIAPIGYSNIRTGKNEPNIIPQEPSFTLVRESFEMLAAGNVALDVCLEEVTRRGLLSRRGNKLTNCQFKRILRNPGYIGKISSKKYGVMPGIHVACITETVFDQVQLLLKRGTKNTNRIGELREAMKRCRW